jgi:hypothetical protein
LGETARRFLQLGENGKTLSPVERKHGKTLSPVGRNEETTRDHDN